MLYHKNKNVFTAEELSIQGITTPAELAQGGYLVFELNDTKVTEESAQAAIALANVANDRADQAYILALDAVQNLNATITNANLAITTAAAADAKSNSAILDAQTALAKAIQALDSIVSVMNGGTA